MGRFDEAYSKAVTFAAGANVSSAADISTLGARGLCLRGNWGDWTTAQIGIQVSYDDGTPTNWVTLWKINADADGYDAVACPDPGSLSNGDVIDVPPSAWIAGNAHWVRLASRNTTTFATPVVQVTQIDIVIGTLA